jgi:ACT domain-containing protein
MTAMGLRIKMRIPIMDAPGRMLEIIKEVERFGGVVDYVRHTRNVQ